MEDQSDLFNQLNPHSDLYTELASNKYRIHIDQVTKDQIQEIKQFQGADYKINLASTKGDLSYILLLLNKLLPGLVFDVTRLENVPVTVPEIMTLMEGITVGGHRISDVESTTNIINAYRYIGKLIKHGATVDVIQLYKTLHSLLSVKLLDSTGKFRDHNVLICGAESYKCLRYDFIPQYVNTIFSEYLASSQQIYDAIRLFCQLVYLQPFEGCNERTARVITNYLLVKNRWGIFSVHHTLIPQFNTLLIDAFNSGNLNELIMFLVDNCVMQFDGTEITKDFTKNL